MGPCACTPAQDLLAASELDRLQHLTKTRIIRSLMELRSIRRFVMVSRPFPSFVKVQPMLCSGACAWRDMLVFTLCLQHIDSLQSMRNFITAFGVFQLHFAPSSCNLFVLDNVHCFYVVGEPCAPSVWLARSGHFSRSSG